MIRACIHGCVLASVLIRHGYMTESIKIEGDLTPSSLMIFVLMKSKLMAPNIITFNQIPSNLM